MTVSVGDVVDMFVGYGMGMLPGRRLVVRVDLGVMVEDAYIELRTGLPDETAVGVRLPFRVLGGEDPEQLKGLVADRVTALARRVAEREAED